MRTKRETYTQRNHLEYPALTLFQMVERIAAQYPKEPAYEFFGTKTSYLSFIRRIERAARAFLTLGIQRGDTVTICMPNTPQALDCFYALNRIGAIANMVHPLSARSEITFYLNISHSKAILTVDLYYEKVEEALLDIEHPVTVLVARIQDELNPLLKAAYTIKAGKDYLRFPNTDHAILWKHFLKKGRRFISLPAPEYHPSRVAVILYSGGTSGTPKGICLSDLIDIGATLDERIADGFYFARSLKLIKYIFANPELLKKPLCEPSGFDYK